jgi:hypothetical protein
MNCPWRPSLLTNQDEKSNLYRGPSIHALYQMSVHSGKRFQRRRLFRNQPIRNKNSLWRPCLLTDRDEMSNLYRGPSMFHRCFLPSFGSFGQAVSEEKIFKNWPIRNKNCLWRACLSMDRDKVSNLYKGLSIDASYQISVHSGKRFQKRFFRNQPIKNKNSMWQPCL